MPVYRATSQNPTTNIANQPAGNLAASLFDAMYQTIWNVLNDSSNGFATLATDTGTINNCVVTNLSPATAYRQGMFQAFLTPNVNTGPAQINVDSLGNVAITTSAGAALGGGELSSTNVNLLLFDGTKFRIISSPLLPLQSFSGFILIPTAQSYTIDLAVAPAKGYLMVQLSAITTAGSCTLQLLQNGTPIGSPFGVSFSVPSVVPIGVAAFQNDRIDLSITSPSSDAVNLAFSMRVQF